MLSQFVCVILAVLSTQVGPRVSNGEPASGDRDDRWTAAVAYGTGPGYEYSGFHVWAFRTAVEILRLSGHKLYADEVALEKYVQFGLTYADSVWLGTPGKPLATLLPTNRFGLWLESSHVPDKQVSHHEERAFCLGQVRSRIDASLRTGFWTAYAEDPSHSWERVSPYYGVEWLADLDVDVSAIADLFGDPLRAETRTVIAADNLFHFANRRPIVLFDSRKGGRPPCEVTSADLKIDGTIVARVSVSADEYGAVLYQVGRKFWPSNNAMPSIRHLPLVREPGTVILRDKEIALPATYLGGQPFVCFHEGQEPAGHGSCASGRPSWPVWFAEDTQLETTHGQEWARCRMAFEAPPKNAGIALTYLGWAMHLIQDLALPAHQGDAQGEGHTSFERFADAVWAEQRDAVRARVLADPTVKLMLRQPAGSTKALCDRLGLSWTLPADGLGQDAVKPFFTATASHSAVEPSGGLPPDPREVAASAMTRAIRDSLLLLACFADASLGETPTCKVMPSPAPTISGDVRASCRGTAQFLFDRVDSRAYSYSLQKLQEGNWITDVMRAREECGAQHPKLSVTSSAMPADGRATRFRGCSHSDCGVVCSEPVEVKHNLVSNSCGSGGGGSSSPCVTRPLSKECKEWFRELLRVRCIVSGNIHSAACKAYYGNGDDR